MYSSCTVQIKWLVQFVLFSVKGVDVYMFVATLQMHLQYESNSAIENSISEDLKQLYNEGHASIKERKKMKRGNNSGDKQNSDNDDKEHGDNGVQNMDSNDDNNNKEQQSKSEEEEEDNEDDDNDVRNSVSEEEKMESKEDDQHIFTL